VGVYLGSERSKNSRVSKDASMVLVQMNASLMGYALKRKAGLEPAFVFDRPTDADSEAGSSLLGESGLQGGEPDTRSGRDWWAISYLFFILFLICEIGLQ